MAEDMKTEWWKAEEADQYSLKDKLLRVGCRPLKRSWLACKKTMQSEESFGQCAVSTILLNSNMLFNRKFAMKWTNVTRLCTTSKSPWLKRLSQRILNLNKQPPRHSYELYFFLSTAHGVLGFWGFGFHE